MSAADIQRYLAALHAIQTGVATEHHQGSDDGSPKHLRTDIASCQISITALVGVLIDKGLLTLDEFQTLIADEAERVVGEYQDRINARYGVEGVVKLR